MSPKITQRIVGLIGALILFISPMLPFTRESGSSGVSILNMDFVLVVNCLGVLLMPLAGLMALLALMNRYRVLRIIGVVTALILAFVTLSALDVDVYPMWGAGVAWTGVLLVLAAGFLGRRGAPPASESGGS